MACNSPGITIQFDENGTLHTAKFTEFGGESVRGYVEAAAITFSATGAVSQSGSTRAARHTWTVASHCDAKTAYALEALYVAYDAARAAGVNVVVAVTDETRRPPGADPVVGNAVFSSAPVFDGGTNGSRVHIVSFGLTEV